MSEGFFRRRRTARELETLQKWPERERGSYAKALAAHKNAEHKFWNFKIGCAGHLIDDRSGSVDYRRDGLIALMKCFSIIESEQVEPPQSSIAALISWPNMFSSEICVFFDSEYESRFTPKFYKSRQRAAPETEFDETATFNLPGPSPFEILDVDLPRGFDVGGYKVTLSYDDNTNFTDELWSVMRSSQTLAEKLKYKESSHV